MVMISRIKIIEKYYMKNNFLTYIIDLNQLTSIVVNPFIDLQILDYT